MLFTYIEGQLLETKTKITKENKINEIIKKAIEEDRPIIIKTKNGQVFMGWVFDRHTDTDGVFISPGFKVLYEDITRITL